MPHETPGQRVHSIDHKRAVHTHSASQLTAALNSAQGGGAAYGKTAPLVAGDGPLASSPPVLTQVFALADDDPPRHVCLAGL